MITCCLWCLRAKALQSGTELCACVCLAVHPVLSPQHCWDQGLGEAHVAPLAGKHKESLPEQSGEGKGMSSLGH